VHVCWAGNFTGHEIIRARRRGRRNKVEGTNTMGQRCSQQQLSIPFRFFSCAPVSEKS
jgi:hypothetical protein